MKIRKLTSLKNDKRGLGIKDLYPIILIIATVAILLAVILMVMAEWVKVTDSDNHAIITNETGLNISAGSYLAAVSTNCSPNNFKAIEVNNGTTIVAANYSLDKDTGRLINLTADVCNSESLANITYSYDFGGADCEAVMNITDDFTDFIPWIGIILLVIAAAIVLGIVIRSFSEGKI